MEITLEQFKKYEAVRKSGAVNMFLTKQVAKLSRLKPEVVSEIRKEYAVLAEKWKREI